MEKGSKGRRPLQNYVNFPMYLTQSIWLALLSGQHAPAVLIAMLAKHLANLGLRLPSEKTCSMITAVLLWHQHRNFDDVQKHQLYIQVKAQLKKLLSCASDQSPGCSYVVDLPLNPNELSKEWQDRAFAQEARADPQMDTQILHMIQSSIRERVSVTASGDSEHVIWKWFAQLADLPPRAPSCTGFRPSAKCWHRNACFGQWACMPA